MLGARNRKGEAGARDKQRVRELHQMVWMKGKGSVWVNALSRAGGVRRLGFLFFNLIPLDVDLTFYHLFQLLTSIDLTALILLNNF